ncbi:hypothetical protein KR200_007635 [Drosophila serrata]|nr:hypothetical protein KR200_007635 [Drosophila serrata]
MLKLLSLLLLVDLGSPETFKFYEYITDEKDWRHYGYISPVQNQGECQASWAMSVIGALEAHTAINNHELVELSAQQLVDCAPHPNNGCHEGKTNDAFHYIGDHGIASKASYPYRAVQSNCSYNSNSTAGRMKFLVTYLNSDEKRLTELVYNIGPVVAHIDNQHESFLEYKSGIYHEENCRSDMENLTLPVLVVGYGTDCKNGSYWILKTSFGLNWGENGYMRLARNKGNMCGVSTLLEYPYVEK